MTQTYNNNSLTFRDYLNRTFALMAVGLAISGLIAWGFSGIIVSVLSRIGIFGLILFCGAELGLAFFFSMKLSTMSTTTAYICYGIYAFMTGISLSSVVLAYEVGSIVFALMTTAVLFACMSIIGHTTKVDISRFSNLLWIGAITMVVVSLLNVFILRSAVVDLLMAYAGVIIFLAIIAYDMQRLRDMYNAGFSDPEMGEKMMIMGSFQLYLDFINLFIKILQIFGRRKDD